MLARGEATLHVCDIKGDVVADPQTSDPKHMVEINAVLDSGAQLRMMFRRGEFNKMLAVHGVRISVAVNLKEATDE